MQLLAFRAQLIFRPEARIGGFEGEGERGGGYADRRRSEKGGDAEWRDMAGRREWKGLTWFWHVDIPGNLIMPLHYEHYAPPLYG